MSRILDIIVSGLPDPFSAKVDTWVLAVDRTRLLRSRGISGSFGGLNSGACGRGVSVPGRVRQIFRNQPVINIAVMILIINR